MLHSIAYIAFLAGRHGLVTVEDIVGDDGPIHELAHYLSGPKMRGGRMKEHLESRVKWLESIVPGMPPENLKLEIYDAFPHLDAAQ